MDEFEECVSTREKIKDKLCQNFDGRIVCKLPPIQMLHIDIDDLKKNK